MPIMRKMNLINVHFWTYLLQIYRLVIKLKRDESHLITMSYSFRVQHSQIDVKSLIINTQIILLISLRLLDKILRGYSCENMTFHSA